MNEEIREIAKNVVLLESRECELLVAKFIVENPDVPINDIELVRKMDPDAYSVVFSVRGKS